MGWKEILLGTDESTQTAAPEVGVKEGQTSSAALASVPAPAATSFAAHRGEGQLSVDVYETLTAIVIVAPIAGVQKEDIKVTVTDDVLEIKGFRRFQDAVRKEQFYSQECFWGTFSRAIVLPARVKPDQVQANLKDGVLKVTVPKAHLAQAQEVPIGTSPL